VLWTVTLTLAVVAAVLGYVGLQLYLQPPLDYADAGPFERAYYTAQMFVLSSSAVTDPPYNPPLLVALFLAPFTTVLAVLQAVSAVFRARYHAWRLRRARGHTIVVGAGPAAFVLAQRLAERRSRWKPIVLVGTDVTPAVARRHRFRVVAGDPMDWATLDAAGVANAARVYALSDTSAVNARIALTLQRRRRTPDGRRRAWPTMAVYARADDARLVAALRAHGLAAEDPGDGYTLDFFSIEERAAAKLLESGDDPARPVAVIGDDRFAAAVVDELRRLRRHAGTTSGIVVRPTAAYHTVPEGTATIYVCAGDPDEVLRIGLQLLLDGHPQVVLCLGRRSLLADALEGPLFEGVDGRLRVFGILDAACRPADLAQSALVEKLAQALHAAYLRQHGGGPQPRPSQVPWAQLAPNFRADNRAQAEHIGAKLRTIDAVVVPAAPGLPPFSFRDDDELDDLAKLEHVRWMEAKEAEHAAAKATGPITHPDYRDWDDGLSEEAKAKDRGFVRNLPALLAEEGLAIVRRPPPGP